MNYKNDELQVDQADLKRRNSTPAILIGTQERVCLFRSSFPKKDLIRSLQDLHMIQSSGQKCRVLPSSPLAHAAPSKAKIQSSRPPQLPISLAQAPTSRKEDLNQQETSIGSPCILRSKKNQRLASRKVRNSSHSISQQ